MSTLPLIPNPRFATTYSLVVPASIRDTFGGGDGEIGASGHGEVQLRDTISVVLMPICVMPLLDRIDIHVEVPRVDYQKLTDDRLGEPSEAIRERVEQAREVQRERFADTSLSSNADMGPGEVREICQLDEAGRGLVRAAMQQLQMSARAFHRILKLARTIADLAESEKIETAHLAEAIQYRPRRMM